MKLAANILSIIFHPLLMITYGVLLALTYTTLAIYPMQLKLWVLAGVFMMTAFVPALFIFLMIKIGKNGDYELTNRTDRTMPYLIYIASVIACVLYLSKMLMPVWVLSLVFGTAVAMLIAMCINFFWKISAHMIGIGGLLGGIMGISRVYLLNPYWAFIIVLLIAGLLGGARIQLKKHTPAQVYAGFGLGFISIYISSLLSYFYFFI